MGVARRRTDLGFRQPQSAARDQRPDRRQHHGGLARRPARLGNRSIFEGLEKPQLDYANVAGEYRFTESYYKSGLFLGLGAYRIAGDVAGVRKEETQIGAVFGADGEFGITRRLTFVIELSGHYVNFSDSARIYALAHAGLAYHF